MNDLKFAFRQLLKNPGYAAIAVLTLAIGIGASTAIFSLVRGVLLTPPPYFEPERVVPMDGVATRIQILRGYRRLLLGLRLSGETERKRVGRGPVRVVRLFFRHGFEAPAGPRLLVVGGFPKVSPRGSHQP